MDTNKQPGSATAIVLAAGMSRRMAAAGPKQLLRVSGKPLLEHALESVHAAGVSEIVLVLGAEAEAIQQQVALGGARIVINPDYRQGMGTSLRAGLAAVASTAGAALVVLADQPFVHLRSEPRRRKKLP
ncbi:MAG TPA: NTP transferase domain-containing protein [Candidatus Angelobacter sp.]|nr:NTP transferase domain-containing protein [Candidatus Angelobacter sp.]